MHVNAYMHVYSRDGGNTLRTHIVMQADDARTVKVEKDRRLADIKAQQRAEVCTHVRLVWRSYTLAYTRRVWGNACSNEQLLRYVTCVT